MNNELIANGSFPLNLHPSYSQFPSLSFPLLALPPEQTPPRFFPYISLDRHILSSRAAAPVLLGCTIHLPAFHSLMIHLAVFAQIVAPDSEFKMKFGALTEFRLR